ncbi:ASCH domain-containing protein [Streptomyces lydicus]|uniref:ASCH domain-containing protein n=1 Tax=Streptomyces lydicus TaxID=47763 RepID=UPI0010121C98|nr:ASCH domain-containing protein [Streptomyces lydicus]MCZ1006036.1 ASCH domain-containing protein [Streptomyces lydicus]
MTRHQDHPDHPDLPQFELGFPGPLRDRLVSAVLSGAKTATTGLLIEYERGEEPLPSAGQRSVVPDSAGRPVAVIELTGVRVVRLAEVDRAHAQAEGEGHTTVATWRAAHKAFWHGPDVRKELGDPDFTIDDDTLVVLETFRIVESLESGSVPAQEG